MDFRVEMHDVVAFFVVRNQAATQNPSGTQRVSASFRHLHVVLRSIEK